MIRAEDIFKTISKGYLVMWRRDDEGVFLDTWDVGLVAEKRIDENKELIIEVNHPDMISFNLEHYLENDAFKMITKSIPA